MFRLIARFSNYDFWNPENFLVGIGKKYFQKLFFQDQKIFAKKNFEKHFHIFSKTKIEIMKNRKVENSKS